jgi:hypothetical protein
MLLVGLGDLSRGGEHMQITNLFLNNFIGVGVFL